MKHYLVMLTTLDNQNKKVSEVLNGTLGEKVSITANSHELTKHEFYWESDSVDLCAMLTLAYSLKEELNDTTLYYMCIDKEWDTCNVYKMNSKSTDVITLGSLHSDPTHRTVRHEKLALVGGCDFLQFNNIEDLEYLRILEYLIFEPKTLDSFVELSYLSGIEYRCLIYNTTKEGSKDLPLKPLVSILKTFINEVSMCDSLKQLNQVLGDIKALDVTNVLKHYSKASGFYEFEESFNKVINEKIRTLLGSVIVEQFVDVFKPLRHRMIDVIEDLTEDLKQKEDFY